MDWLIKAVQWAINFLKKLMNQGEQLTKSAQPAMTNLRDLVSKLGSKNGDTEPVAEPVAEAAAS